MRVAYLLENTSFCGGVKVVLQHALLLVKEGFSITIITKTGRPRWLDTEGLDFLDLQNRAFSDITDILSGFDLVIATFYPQVLELYRMPLHLIHFSQGYEADCLFWREQRSDIEKAYHLPVPKVTISKRVAAIIEEKFFQTPHFVQQGIDIDKFSVRKRPSVARKVIIVGTWENEIKGIRHAVSGFSLAKKKKEDLYLVRVSTLPLSEEERSVYHAEEYHTAVLPEDMPDLYSESDLAIVPSLEGEGFGLPAIEAMACGLPVILTRTHSFLSLDSRKDYAYFVSPSSSHDIAEALLHLYQDNDLRERLGRRARHVAEFFSLQETREQLVPALTDILRVRLIEKRRDIHFIYVQHPAKDDSREEIFLREMSRDTYANGFPFQTIVSANPTGITVREALDSSDTPFIVICLDDTLYFSENWFLPLLEALGKGFDIASPVYADFLENNMPYYTPLTFNDVADSMKRTYHGQYIEQAQIALQIFAVKRTALSLLSPDMPFSELPGQLRAALVPSSLVHRFGDYFGYKRDDILAFIPYGVRKVLDIGCAKGELGATIKRERGCEVYGVEFNTQAAEEAKTKMDVVYCTDIEQTHLTFNEDLDVVVFADVLEHLVDPWSLLRNTLPWLKSDGLVVASIPNVAHYSIILDLLRGRWDYVPSGLLCVTHLRFFTRKTIRTMFVKAGYTLLTLTNQSWPEHLREQIEHTLARYIKTENVDEDIFSPGFYVVAKKNTEGAS